MKHNIVVKYHIIVTTVGPVQFISELLINHSFSMMFIILTHDNQSTLSLFSLLLSFVTNSPLAESPL